MPQQRRPLALTDNARTPPLQAHQSEEEQHPHSQHSLTRDKDRRSGNEPQTAGSIGRSRDGLVTATGVEQEHASGRAGAFAEALLCFSHRHVAGARHWALALLAIVTRAANFGVQFLAAPDRWSPGL
jgi:hypothetical protein